MPWINDNGDRAKDEQLPKAGWAIDNNKMVIKQLGKDREYHVVEAFGHINCKCGDGFGVGLSSDHTIATFFMQSGKSKKWKKVFEMYVGDPIHLEADTDNA